MTDLRDRFAQYDEVPVPDLWDRIEDLAAAPLVAKRARPRLLVAFAAAVVVLVAVGGPLLLFGTTGPGEIVAESPAAEAWDATGWELNPADGPFTRRIAAVEPVSPGGFIAVTADPGRIFWSPDGVEWFDADPQRQVAQYQPKAADLPSEDDLAAVTGSRVVVLDRADSGVWVGDPKTGDWEPIRLDVVEPGAELELLAVAANDTEALVVAREQGSSLVEVEDAEEPSSAVLSIPVTDRYLAWVVDPRTGTAQAYTLPVPVPEAASDADAVIEWFNGRWVIVLGRGNVWAGDDQGWDARQAVLVSPDGASWLAVDAPEEWKGAGLTSLTAGPSSIIATTCHFGGDSFWYSTDGTSWVLSTSDHTGHRSAYIEGLGFIARYESTPMDPAPLSADGRTWHPAVTLERYRGDTERLAAADGRLIAIDSELWLWSTDD